MPPPPPPAAPPADFQKKLDDLKTQLASAEKNHASQMKDAESKLSNLQGNSSKEMETLRLQFAKDMEALRKAMEEVQVVLNKKAHIFSDYKQQTGTCDTVDSYIIARN